MNDIFDYEDKMIQEEEEKYSKMNVFERAWNTLECLGIYAEGEELLKFLEGFHSKAQLKKLIRNFNKMALHGVNPIRHIDERAEAVEFLIECIKEELEEEQKQEEIIE